MNDFCSLVMLFCVGSEVTVLICTIIAYLWRRSQIRKWNYSLNNKEKIDLYLLLPALFEQDIVEETICNFNNLKVPYEVNLKIIIITTEKEKNLNLKTDNFITTEDIVSDFLKTNLLNHNFFHIHCPKIKGTKSTQLNYAIKKIAEKIEKKNFENTYIGVYDFDSKPDPETILEFLDVVNTKKKPHVIQQLPLSIKNYVAISKRKPLVIAQGAQQIIRSMGIEYLKLIGSHMGLKYIPQYCLGAGMFIRYDILKKYGDFPEPVDDITLGYRYSLYKLRFEPLLHFNYVDLPPNMKSVFNQRILIFKGIVSFVDEIKKFRQNKEKNAIGIISLFLEGVFNTIWCTIIPYLYLIYSFYAIVSLNYYAITIMLALLMISLLRGILGEHIIMKYLPVPPENKGCLKKIYFNSIIGGIFYRIWKTFGSIMFTVKTIRSAINHENMVFQKTERK